MIRSAVSWPPMCGRMAPIRMVSGMSAVSELDASATARSKPTIRWKRLTARSAKAGRSQKVSVLRTRSRSMRAVPPSFGHRPAGDGASLPWRPLADEGDEISARCGIPHRRTGRFARGGVLSSTEMRSGGREVSEVAPPELAGRQDRDRGEDLVLALVGAHADSLLRVARRHSLCHDDAHDAYQRSLEILLRHAPRLDSERAYKYAHTIVKHEAMLVRAVRSRTVTGEEIDLDRHAA